MMFKECYHIYILIDKEIATSYSSALKDIKEYSNGNIIGVGFVKDTYNTDALVMTLDNTLSMLNQEHFGDENYDMFNAVTILLVAIVFNGVFKWRRYPAHLQFKKQAREPLVTETIAKDYEAINHEDFVYALSHIDTYVDIDEGDLVKIYNLATKRHIEIK